MRAFVALLERLAFTPRRNDKLRLVVLTGEGRARIEAARWSGPAAA